ncbi:HalOD1 output domain-containing protein [Halomarina salina]|uniref:HalOD1 output domain-containing protein n=1 Tax=Halomarina salina TaxID=1872699 RepID=A0ABD5RIR0_9EURY
MPDSLTNVVDSDALDHLFAQKRPGKAPSAVVTFCYCGCLVTVSDNRTIVVQTEFGESPI